VHQIEAGGQLVPFRVRELNAGTNEVVGENVSGRAAGNRFREISSARESPHISTVLAYQERGVALRNMIQQSQVRSFLMALGQFA
jgi:hypothetical protein